MNAVGHKRDVVVTVPKGEWSRWIQEGALPTDPPADSDIEFYFFLGGNRPAATLDRCYVVSHGRLRGYAPVVRIDDGPGRRFAIVRRGRAVACTVEQSPIRGFQGWRYRWWPRIAERPFPNWQEEGVT